jgi:ketosteroid isomerase-like protein
VKNAIAICLLFLTAALSATTLSAASSEQAVRIAEKAFSDAIVAGDVATLEQVMADDATYGHASGNTDTKRTYIDRIRSGAQKYVSFHYDEGTQVRVYGDTAVVNASAEIRSVTDGKPNELHLRMLHVFVRRNGRWQLVAHQSVKLPA